MVDDTWCIKKRPSLMRQEIALEEVKTLRVISKLQRSKEAMKRGSDNNSNKNLALFHMGKHPIKNTGFTKLSGNDRATLVLSALSTLLCQHKSRHTCLGRFKPDPIASSHAWVLIICSLRLIRILCKALIIHVYLVCFRTTLRLLQNPDDMSRVYDVSNPDSRRAPGLVPRPTFCLWYVYFLKTSYSGPYLELGDMIREQNARGIPSDRFNLRALP